MPTPTQVASCTTPTISAGWRWRAAIGSSSSACPITSFVEQGVVFAVVRAEIDYLKPAVLGDEVEVTVEPVHLRRVRFTLGQDVYRCADNAKLVSAQITVACLTPDGRITTVPPSLAESLSQRLRAAGRRTDFQVRPDAADNRATERRERRADLEVRPTV